MSEDANFLTRWSRRKQEVAKEARLEEKPAAEPHSAEGTSEAPAKPETTVDLTKLPSLDEIVAETDISGFLQQGVPTDLARAALRRAWTSDPAIRDFVGLQENDWVFNKPGPEEGFGPLGPETDVGKLLAQVFGESPKEDVPAQNADMPATSKRSEAHVELAKADIERTDAPPAVQDDAPHNTSTEAESSRAHGGALPRPISES